MVQSSWARREIIGGKGTLCSFAAGMKETNTDEAEQELEAGADTGLMIG